MLKFEEGKKLGGGGDQKVNEIIPDEFDESLWKKIEEEVLSNKTKEERDIFNASGDASSEEDISVIHSIAVEINDKYNKLKRGKRNRRRN